MPCFVCSQHAVYPSAGAKNVHMEKHHLIWGAVICCSSPLTSDGQNSSPTPPTPASTDKAFVLLLHMKSQSGWKTNAHSCLSEPILLFFLLHCQKKVFSSNEVPSSISTSERSANKSAEFCKFCGCSCMNGFPLDWTRWCHLWLLLLCGCIYKRSRVKQCYRVISTKGVQE